MYSHFFVVVARFTYIECMMFKLNLLTDCSSEQNSILNSVKDLNKFFFQWQFLYSEVRLRRLFHCSPPWSYNYKWHLCSPTLCTSSFKNGALKWRNLNPMYFGFSPYTSVTWYDSLTSNSLLEWQELYDHSIRVT